MDVKVFLVDAFCYNDNGGNPAGVVLDADSLDETQMQVIAKEVGFSETAFVTLTSLKIYVSDTLPRLVK